jgi:hypothetical protein
MWLTTHAAKQRIVQSVCLNPYPYLNTLYLKLRSYFRNAYTRKFRDCIGLWFRISMSSFHFVWSKQHLVPPTTWTAVKHSHGTMAIPNTSTPGPCYAITQRPTEPPIHLATTTNREHLSHAHCIIPTKIWDLCNYLHRSSTCSEPSIPEFASPTSTCHFILLMVYVDVV